jgi:hypothetical protein
MLCSSLIDLNPLTRISAIAGGSVPPEGRAFIPLAIKLRCFPILASDQVVAIIVVADQRFYKNAWSYLQEGWEFHDSLTELFSLSSCNFSSHDVMLLCILLYRGCDLAGIPRAAASERVRDRPTSGVSGQGAEEGEGDAMSQHSTGNRTATGVQWRGSRPALDLQRECIRWRRLGETVARRCAQTMKDDKTALQKGHAQVPESG